MSNNSGQSSNEDESINQPFITDYITPTCAVCGRVQGDQNVDCHPRDIIKVERWLANGKWLLSSQRPSADDHYGHYVCGNDHVTFEPLYGTLRPLIDNHLDQFDEHMEKTPCEIPTQEWIASAHRRDMEFTDDIVMGLLAAIKACETRVKQRSGDAAPADIFAHLVYLGQYELIPGNYDPNLTGSLREFCADYCDVAVSNLNSKWVIERRIDRSKVFSTTKEFRREWDLELVSSSPAADSQPASKSMNNVPVLEDHRDHNLVTREAKRELLGLPYVDWSVAPHLFYSEQTVEEDSEDSTHTPIGFDFAGFKYTPDGQKLRYLGVVTDHKEEDIEIYSQIEQLNETDANGLVIMPNREAIYDFLHFLHTVENIAGQEWLPETRDEYSSIPNVRLLHEDVVTNVDFLDGIAFLPRRKFLDEGFQTIDDLIAVKTYA